MQSARHALSHLRDKLLGPVAVTNEAMVRSKEEVVCPGNPAEITPCHRKDNSPLSSRDVEEGPTFTQLCGDDGDQVGYNRCVVHEVTAEQDVELAFGPCLLLGPVDGGNRRNYAARATNGE